MVDIVTPNFLHKEIAMAAIAAGKHVYCEKPLALSAPEAKEMYQAAEKAGVKTLVGFNYLRNPAIAEARRLIATGALGEIWTFNGQFVLDACSDPNVPFTWRFERKLSGSGALGDLGAHIISLAQVLVGPIASVAGINKTFIKTRPEPTGVFGYGSGADLTAPRREVENDDYTSFVMEFANGASGHIEASRVATGRTWHQSIEVIGSLGALQFVQQDIHTLRLYLTGDPVDKKGYREVELGPSHGDYGVFWPFAGVPIGVHELKTIEVTNGSRDRGGPPSRRRLQGGLARLRGSRRRRDRRQRTPLGRRPCSRLTHPSGSRRRPDHGRVHARPLREGSSCYAYRSDRSRPYRRVPRHHPGRAEGG